MSTWVCFQPLCPMTCCVLLHPPSLCLLHGCDWPGSHQTAIRLTVSDIVHCCAGPWLCPAGDLRALRYLNSGQVQLACQAVNNCINSLQDYVHLGLVQAVREVCIRLEGC
jgi:hypothetical protein